MPSIILGKFFVIVYVVLARHMGACKQLISPTLALFAVLVLEAAAGVVCEKNTVGWLVAGGCCWSGVKKNTASWLEAAGTEQGL